jgi:hypothetical protein
MTQYEHFTSMSIEDLAAWIDEHGQFDNSPWMNWFDENYCRNCSPITISKKEQKEKLGFEALYNIDATCAYCEVHKECRFFQGRPTPTLQEIILMWLKETVADEEK